MKTLLQISLLTLALAAPAFAGPSDGTGTNLVIQENELTDFVKARAEQGDKQIQIAPRTFKQSKQAAPVYEGIKPLIERAEQLYPGLGSKMEQAFDKPWLVVNAEFTARNSSERKVISQTDSAVYVSEKWLRKASPEQVAKAFFHEGVRHFAHDFIDDALLNKVEDHHEIDDTITEELTPVLYAKLPPAVLEGTMQKIPGLIGDYGITRLGWASGGPLPKLASRAEIYADLKAVDARKVTAQLCAPAGMISSYFGQPRKNAAALIRAAKMEDAIIAYNPYSSANRRKVTYDDATNDLLEMLVFTLVNDDSPKKSAENMERRCSRKKYEDALRELERSQGKVEVKDAAPVSELPDEDGEAPAN